MPRTTLSIKPTVAPPAIDDRQRNLNTQGNRAEPGRRIRGRSRRTHWARAGLLLGAIVFTLAILLLAFRGTILNGYVKGKAERAFAQSHPGYTLHLGELHYSLVANRLVAQSAALTASNVTLTAGSFSLTGVHWRRAIWQSAPLAEVLADTTLEATNFAVEFPQANYGIRCARLRLAAPDSEFMMQGAELRTLIGDEEFFAASKFRTTRFHLSIPECRAAGLRYRELLQGTAYRAGSLHFFAPSFDALVNRDAPVDTNSPPPLMVHEALATIPVPFQIDTLSITNGRITYRERVVAGASPGVLTFADTSLSITNVANRADSTASIELNGQSELMNDGTLKLRLSLPISPTNLCFRYWGSLSAMDLPKLDAFLDIAEHLRIKSGRAHEAVFDITVNDGKASGRVRAIYDDLVVAVLDKKDGTETGLGNRVASLLVNTLKIEKSNGPDASGVTKEGKVDYARKPDTAFLQFAWFALRSGVMDAINQ